ncbi:protoporphyrinogen oxidase [Hydrogenibacillus sp. N12]|uniref:protoporphyrinogen oxidase n=1 Tax=Hydrogenibacillus sp. N12 TaxID=2866627 RepID=UPI001C7DA5DD|nr:protoporphyrinogen oxidase [Hydrogenibacillus sp. N12]QZA32990.1 protoporphyrinogen oxidase [Hydrogenibacillus sp. N12]
MTRVVVVGGGLAGLAAAYALSPAAGAPWRLPAERLPEVVVVERSPRFGGKIDTVRRDGYVIERGPDSFLARKPAARRLVAALGLDGEAVGTGPEGRGAYVFFRGRLHPLPEGMATGIPTRLGPLVRTGLLSLRGKARAALELFLPRGPAGDEALGAFLTRRFGREVTDRLAGPLLSGIYAGDVDRLSVLATFPHLKALEARHGSLLRAMLAGPRERPPAIDPPWPEAVQSSTFVSFRRGLLTVVEALTTALAAGGARLIAGRGAVAIRKEGSAYAVALEGGEAIRAEAVILAVPAAAARALLGPAGEAFLPLEAGTPYASVANVAVWTEAAALSALPPGSGFVVARDGRPAITAVTWTTRKWPHTTPPGGALFRVYFGDATTDVAERLTDAELEAAALSFLQETSGVRRPPAGVLVSRWRAAMPAYGVGHRERLSALRAALERTLPGIFVAGSAYDGVGLPDVAESGRRAAEAALDYLQGGGAPAPGAGGPPEGKEAGA